MLPYNFRNMELSAVFQYGGFPSGRNEDIFLDTTTCGHWSNMMDNSPNVLSGLWPKCFFIDVPVQIEKIWILGKLGCCGVIVTARVAMSIFDGTDDTQFLDYIRRGLGYWCLPGDCKHYLKGKREAVKLLLWRSVLKSPFIHIGVRIALFAEDVNYEVVSPKRRNVSPWQG